MRLIKKLTACILSLLIIASLAGCSSDNTGKNAKDNNSDSLSSGYDGSMVTITYWHTHGDSEEAILKDKIIPKFNEIFENIEVQAVRMPTDGLKQQIVQGISSKTCPDLMRMDIVWVQEFAKMGALEMLDNKEGFADIKAGCYDAPMSTNLYNGNYYGVPINTNTKTGIWSKKLLNELGLSEAPKTWDELLALSERLTEKQYLFAISSINTWDIMPVFFSLGGSFTNEDYTKSTGYLNSEASVNALKTIIKWYENGLISPSLLGGSPDKWNGIINGSVLCGDEGPWFHTNNKETDVDETITALLPAGSAGSVSVVGGEDLVIFASGTNKDAAWEFAKFLMSEYAQEAILEAGLIPALKVAAESETAKNNTTVQIYFKQLETAVARTPNPNWEKMNEAIEYAFESAVRGAADIKDALDEAAMECDGFLK